ncbi:MAG: hypothetical protein WD399_07295 [Thermoleophilaceae bacterium]
MRALPGAATASIAVLVWGAPMAVASPASRAIDALNRQRAEHGIPGGIVEDPRWSKGCRQHMAYLERNRLPLAHEQDSSLPGATPLGAEAGTSSVLGYGRFTRPDGNPWENAPIHLMQLLAPDLSVTGYAHGCMWTWPGYLRHPPPAPVLYSYPGEGATIYPAQVAREKPFVPGDFVGLPEGTRTGPHLYVLAAGTGVGEIVSATLSGPGGDVPVRVVDNSTPTVGRYLPAGGVLIPVRPLRSGSRYSVTVELVDETGTILSRVWSFRTYPRGSVNPRLRLRVGSRVVRVRSRSGARSRLTVRSLPSRRVVYRGAHRGPLARSLRLHLPPGRYRACVRQAPNRLYARARACSSTHR